jgi:hypothetical protein
MQVIALTSLGMAAFIGLIYGEVVLLQKWG